MTLTHNNDMRYTLYYLYIIASILMIKTCNFILPDKLILLWYYQSISQYDNDINMKLMTLMYDNDINTKFNDINIW